MSGGYFDYNQFYIDAIIERLNEIDDIKVKDEIDDLLLILIKTRIRLHRLDWYLSGDTGYKGYVERLKEELKKLEEANV